MTQESDPTIVDSSDATQGESVHQKMTGDPQVKTTIRKCKARLLNSFDEEISDVTLRHRRANDENKEDSGTWSKIPAGGKSPTISIRYETGFAADGDYWYVSFLYKKVRWICKHNFYCDLTSDDEGGTVKAIVDRGRKNEEMHIKPPKSSNCTVKLYPFS